MDQEQNKDQTYQTYEIFNSVEVQKRQNLKEVKQDQELIQENILQDEDYLQHEQKTIFQINQASKFQSDLNKEVEEPKIMTQIQRQVKQKENNKKEKFLVEEIQIKTTQINKVQENQLKTENGLLFIQAQQESKLILNPIMPKLNKNIQEDYVNVIFGLYKIYDEQIPKEVFISSIYNQHQLEAQITENNVNISNQLSKFLSGFRKIKSDPNSFFAALSFQFFQIALKQQNQSQFENDLSWIQNLNIAIKTRQFIIDDNYFQNHQNYFLQKIQEIYVSRNPEEQLEQIMNDRQSQFYGLSIIYFRNLISQLIIDENSDKNEEAEEIKFWENSLSNANNIFELLAERLKIQIHEYNINKQKSQVYKQIYGDDTERQIHLLCLDEHYDIGISKF
ncbi:unnamed protein product [Paramecium sonneborni]|uniref:Uncharacterized protein n=1 Tax=Paramecium sonneborni TaxID=65129 RepID=A0A8S1LJL8_9CILI|nr:unnamed protein product [Paramecium sonneborni]